MHAMLAEMYLRLRGEGLYKLERGRSGTQQEDTSEAARDCVTDARPEEENFDNSLRFLSQNV